MATTHKHHCFTCNKIWECNDTLCFSHSDDQGEEFFIACDDPENYEYMCQQCSDANVPNPALENFADQLRLLGGSIEMPDGTVLGPIIRN